VKVTLFWAHNATVTLGKLSKTGIAVTLTKALFRAPTTVDTMDVTEMFEANALADKLVERDSLLIQWQLIFNRTAVTETGVHLFQMP
jgi:hypothetical protein